MNNVITEVNTQTKKGAALIKYSSEQMFTAGAAIYDKFLTNGKMILPGKKISGVKLNAWLKPS